jgi:hypothetical protein
MIRVRLQLIIVYLGRFYMSNSWVEEGPLSHKQGGLIHQFGAASLNVNILKLKGVNIIVVVHLDECSYTPVSYS